MFIRCFDFASQTVVILGSCITYGLRQDDARCVLMSWRRYEFWTSIGKHLWGGQGSTTVMGIPRFGRIHLSQKRLGFLGESEQGKSHPFTCFNARGVLLRVFDIQIAPINTMYSTMIRSVSMLFISRWKTSIGSMNHGCIYYTHGFLL